MRLAQNKIQPAQAEFGSVSMDLGRHRLAKSCLYLSPLKNIDLQVLGHLIRTDLCDLDKKRKVQPG